MSDMKVLMERAAAIDLPIPAFNVPYLPMMGAIVEALRESRTFALIAVARLEWIKFGAKSQAAIAEEYARVGDRRYTRLHQDHVPAIDEDGLVVDYRADIETALDLGYDSVMIDASRLPFEENAEATAEICRMAHGRGVPVEAELGSVPGHEASPAMDYEAMFAARFGFTDPEEAALFVERTGVDWLSVAVGSVHGSITPAAKGKGKIAARLDIAHLAAIHERTRIPLVLHGGSAIPLEYLELAFRNGIRKLNIAADLRNPYEAALSKSPEEALDAVRTGVRGLVDRLGIADSAAKLGLG